MSHSDLKLLNGIPSGPTKYSQIGRRYDHLFSNFSIEKVKEKRQRKAVGNLYDLMSKTKDIQTRSMPQDQYISVKGAKQAKYLPTIRKLCPESNSKQVIDEKEIEEINNNDKDNHHRHYNDTEEEDNFTERVQKVEFIKRINQRKLTKINNLKKMCNNVPQIGHYFPCYSLVEKKVPFVLFKGRSVNKEEPNTRKALSLSHIKQDDCDSNRGKNNNVTGLRLKDSSNSAQKKSRQRKPTYMTSIIESGFSKINNAFPVLIQKNNQPIRTKKREREKDLSNVVAFEKMKGREIMISHKINNCNIPTLGTYSPKYTCIDKDKKFIAFNGQLTYAVHKKNIINKAIHDYNKSKEFIIMKLLHESAGPNESLLQRSSHKQLNVKNKLYLN